MRAMARILSSLFALLLLVPASASAGDDESSDEAEEEAPAAEAPAAEAPAAEAPAEAAPGDAPAAEAPADADAPAAEAPAEEAPTEAEAPVESAAEAPAEAEAPPAEAGPEEPAAADPWAAKRARMTAHMAALKNMPPPPLEIELPHGFKLVPMLQVQALATLFDQADPDRNDPVVHGDPNQTPGFSIRRARFGLGASWMDLMAFSLLAGYTARYDALIDTPEPFELVEATFVLQPKAFLGFQAGYQRVAVGRQAQVSSNNLTLHERSLLSEKMVPGREAGVLFFGAMGPDGNQALPSDAFKWAIGISNGSRDLLGDRDPTPRLAGRASIDLMNSWANAEVDWEHDGFSLTVGGGANYNWGLEAETLTAGGDLGLRVWRFTILGEVLYSKATPTFDTEGLPDFLAERASLGWMAQVGCAIIPGHLDVSVRVDGYDDHTELSDAGDRLDVTGGVGFYLFKQRMKVQLDYTHREELTEGFATDNDSMVLMLQARL